MARFTHTFPVDPAYVLVPVASRPVFTGVMANAIAHLGISSTKYELTIGADGIPLLSMKYIRDVVRVASYLHNQTKRRTKRK